MRDFILAAIPLGVMFAFLASVLFINGLFWGGVL